MGMAIIILYSAFRNSNSGNQSTKMEQECVPFLMGDTCPNRPSLGVYSSSIKQTLLSLLQAVRCSLFVVLVDIMMDDVAPRRRPTDKCWIVSDNAGEPTL
jgi:hypothetical protein